jgi:hypothetical protein
MSGWLQKCSQTQAVTGRGAEAVRPPHAAGGRPQERDQPGAAVVAERLAQQRRQPDRETHQLARPRLRRPTHRPGD